MHEASADSATYGHRGMDTYRSPEPRAVSQPGGPARFGPPIPFVT